MAPSEGTAGVAGRGCCLLLLLACCSLTTAGGPWCNHAALTLDSAHALPLILLTLNPDTTFHYLTSSKPDNSIF